MFRFSHWQKRHGGASTVWRAAPHRGRPRRRRAARSGAIGRVSPRGNASDWM